MTRKGGWVEKILGTIVPEGKVQVQRIPQRTRESNKGSTDVLRTRWTDRRPHPANMDKYEDLNKDSAVSTAITMKAGMIAGVGFHTEMPGDIETVPDVDHPQITKLNDYLELINMDELGELIVRTCQEKGFCPTERLSNGSFKVLPPESFFIWTTQTGDIYKYTQESSGNRKLAEWSKEEGGFDDILVYYRLWSPSRPYGKAMVEDLVSLVESRKQNSEDVTNVIHKQGYPFRVLEASSQETGDILFKALSEKEPEEDVYVYPIIDGELRIHTETLTPRVDFTDYIKHSDEKIAEGLIAPLPVWMKNANEASANVILDTIKIDVEKDQRYFARKFEKEIYAPQVGEPTPRHVWGPSETGLEEITLEGVAALYNGGRGAISYPQAQKLLHELRVPIGEEETEAPKPEFELPVDPMNPEQDQELYVLEANYEQGKITFAEAMIEGGRIIDINVRHRREKSIKALTLSLGKCPDPISEESEQHFTLLRNELYGGFRKKLLDLQVKK